MRVRIDKAFVRTSRNWFGTEGSSTTSLGNDLFIGGYGRVWGLMTVVSGNEPYSHESHQAENPGIPKEKALLGTTIRVFGRYGRHLFLLNSIYSDLGTIVHQR